jgi:hypothetical protein
MVKKVVLLVLGMLAILGGVLSAAGGGAILAAFGSDGEIRSGTHQVTTQGRALVSEVAEFSGLSDTPSWVDRPDVLFDATSDDEIFVGIGRAADVDSYLAGSAIGLVRDFDLSPYRLDIVERPGDAVPSDPANQDFWVASEQGQDVSLTWEIRDGDYRLVVMNLDASAGIDTSARLGIQVPFLGPLALGLLVAGIVVLIAGVVMLVMGLRARSHEAATTGAPG